MRPTDQMLARLGAEADEKAKFVDGVIEQAEKEGRDLSSQELELVTRSRDRQQELSEQMEPLKEARRISGESKAKLAEISEFMNEREAAKPKEIEYRSAGAYVNDYWKAALGADEARERLDLYERAAAHQTTADNPGLLPTPIVQPVINFIDASRPIVSWLGPRQIPSNTWVRPKVTQHTNVALQPVGEKNELVSQKMTIAKQTVTATTYGGYVNVSPSGHRLVDALDHGHGDQRPGRGLRAEDRERGRDGDHGRRSDDGDDRDRRPDRGGAERRALGGGGPDLHGHRRPGTAGDVRLRRPPRAVGAALCPGQPDERDLAGLQRGRPLDGRDGPDLRHPRLHVGGPGGGLDGRRLLGCVRGLRGPDRLAAGARALGAGRAGRLRRLLRLAGRRDGGPGQDHQDAMSDVEPIEEYDTSGLLDAPNQQVVRPDASGPADEGEGGSTAEPEPATRPSRKSAAGRRAGAARGGRSRRDDQERADRRGRAGGGSTSANTDMTKAEIREARG